MKLLRYLPRFRLAYRELERLAEREAWSRSEIEAWQLDRLNRMWRKAWEEVPYYQRLRLNLRLPPQFSSLAEFTGLMPTLEKSVVRDDPYGFLAPGQSAGRWHLTGGSTGVPTRVFWSYQAHWETLRSRYRCASAWGVDILDRQAMLWGHAASLAPGYRSALARLIQPLEDRLRGRLRLSAYRLGHDDLKAYLNRLRGFRPALIYGYSSALYLMAEQALAEGFACDSLKLAILSGEPAYRRLVSTIEKAFAVPAVNEYGSMECGIIAHEWPDRTLRVREDTTLVETLPRTDGQFDIAVTVLANQSFPLFRYLVGDLTDKALERPSQGFAKLRSVSGRNVDMLVSRSGRLVHSLGVKHVFEHYPGVRRFSAHQDTSGHLRVFLEQVDHMPVDKQDASRKLTDLLEGYSVSIEVVDVIPGTVAGKHRWIISDLVKRDASEVQNAI